MKQKYNLQGFAYRSTPTEAITAIPHIVHRVIPMDRMAEVVAYHSTTAEGTTLTAAMVGVEDTTEDDTIIALTIDVITVGTAVEGMADAMVVANKKSI